jgi:uncharacterized membrane protein
MLLFLLGIISGIIAGIIGFWRHTCVFWETRFRMGKASYNTPLGWTKPMIRYGTLIAVCVFSVVFASCWALLIISQGYKLLGEFSWGSLLFLRWVVSGVVASVVNQRLLSKYQWEQAEREAKHPQRSAQS